MNETELTRPLDKAAMVPDFTDISGRVDGRVPAVARERMETLGITAQDLADRSGIHWTTLSRFFNGHTRLNFSNLVRLALALECSGWDDLLGQFPANLSEDQAQPSSD